MSSESLAHYELVEEIAHGGMGIVYRARDTRLDRDVAIKVIRANVASTVDVERFLREIRIAARLQHPGILTIHDSGEADGLLYYVMPLVTGETLADRLARDGALSLDDAVQIACEVAEALAYAHGQGVVHRDIKPSNILLSGGRAVVADFGLALALDAAEEDEKLTQAGVALGTPLYMSPEQASGDASLDGRSDLYSLACVLYEMLAGKPPFTGSTTREILKGHLFDAPPPLRASRPEITEALEAVVRRALAKAPTDRFTTTDAFLRALAPGWRTSHPSDPARRSYVEETQPTRAMPSIPALRGRRRLQIAAVLLALALVLAVLAVVTWRVLRPTPEMAELAPVVAVLPFDNMTGSDSLDHVGTGTARAIVSNLSTLRGVTMMSGATVDAESSANPGTLARELGANYVVTGSIQAVGERLQVTTQLVRADNSVAWGNTYQGDVSALFDIQRRISQGIGDALTLAIRPEDPERLAEPPTRDREAYAEYSQGRSFLERRFVPGNAERALALLERAVERDPSFALAHAGLAEAQWERYRETLDPAWTDRALASAETARRLDPDRAEVRYALALVYDGMGRGDAAMANLEQALSADPRHDEALRLKGTILAGRGQVDDAVETLKRAVDIRPDFWGHYQALGLVLLRAGRFVEAQEVFRRITELQPDLAWGYQMLGTAYHMNDELELAVASYERAIAAGESPAALSNLGVIHYREGSYDEAVENFEASIALEESAIGRRNLGDAYRKVGRESDARAAYERGAEVARGLIEIDPRDDEAWAVLAVCEAKLGRSALALEHAERAVELAPESADALQGLAVVHVYAGRASEAIDALARAVELGYSISEIELDDDFEPLRKEPRFRSLVTRASVP